MMSDGFKFDFKGERAARVRLGSLPEGLEQIRIENRFGTVQVHAAELGDEGWCWELTTWADSNDLAERFARQIDIRLQHEDHMAIWKLVLPEPPQRQLRGVRSNLTLRIPASVAVEIRNRGDVIAKDLQGFVEIQNAHGDVALRNLAGECTASNEHGEIAAAHLATAKLSSRHGALTAEDLWGDLEVRCEHGKAYVSAVAGDLAAHNRHANIEANDIAGDVDIDSAHGHIVLTKSAGHTKLRNRHGRIRAAQLSGYVDVENQHGDIDLSWGVESMAIESVRAITSHASITATLPEDFSGPIAARVKHGQVQSEFPVGISDDSRILFEARHGNVRILGRADPLRVPY